MSAGADIAVWIPFGAARASLVACFTTTGAEVTVGGAPQISGVTANDFTSPVVYRVRAADGTTKDTMVSVQYGSVSGKFTAPDAGAGDRFGSAVAGCGDYVVVGVPGNDARGTDAGAAYVLHRTGTATWDAGTRLVASDAAAGDHFGAAVSIDGDYVVVGAPDADPGGTSSAGAAYVFHRTDTNTWDSGTKLTSSSVNVGVDDCFGGAVAISGSYLITGASGDDTDATDAGAAFVFLKTGTNSWSGIMVTASDLEGWAHFGNSVAISGDYAIVGEFCSGTGNEGAALVFHRIGLNNWGAVGKRLTASDAANSDYFGCSVAIGGDYVVVGANYQDGGATDTGAAYIFHRIAVNTWDSGTKLLAPDAQVGDQFGVSASIRGDYAVVGAIQADAGGTDTGAAYVFQRVGTNAWSSLAKLLASDAQSGDHFGCAAAISDYGAIVGAKDKDGGGTDAGATYIYPR